MEFLEGEGIDGVLRGHGRMRLARAIPILAQIADALEYAHRARIVHRDLKPENVLLTTVRDQADFVKLLDFGIARIQTASFSGRLTLQGQIFGTAEYVSPEQAMDKDVDGRSDLYAVGILAFEMTTGSVPFEGPAADVLHAHVQKPPLAPSLRVPRGELPAAFDAIVLRLLARIPTTATRPLDVTARSDAAARPDGGGRRWAAGRHGAQRLRRGIVDTGGWRRWIASSRGARGARRAGIRDASCRVSRDFEGERRGGARGLARLARAKAPLAEHAASPRHGARRDLVRGRGAAPALRGSC